MRWKRSVRDAKTPAARPIRSNGALLKRSGLRTEAANASSRFNGDRSRRRAYFKRVFIQAAPLSKDGLLTVMPALRKAKAARNSKT